MSKHLIASPSENSLDQLHSSDTKKSFDTRPRGSSYHKHRVNSLTEKKNDGDGNGMFIIAEENASVKGSVHD